MRLKQLEVTREGELVHIRLSGQHLGAREATELVAVAQELAEDRDIRVVVLASAGPDLCPGPSRDLDPQTMSPDPASALAALRVPLVVACAGRAASVGLELVLACDVRLAAASATFALPDVADGRLPCWGGTQRLPRAVGRPRALAMVMLGEELTAHEAHRSGLVHDVVDDLDAAVDSVVATLAGQAPLALQLAKEAIARGAELPMRDALVLEGDLNHLLQTTADRAEGLQAFFDKRPPAFTGR